MAVNTSRSQNAELDAGSTDGTYKKLIRDRSNVGMGDSNRERANMPWPYGFAESPSKIRPDGKPARSSSAY